MHLRSRRRGAAWWTCRQLKIYELVWEENALTVTPRGNELKPAVPTRLRVRCGDVVHEVSLLNTSVDMGRQAHNDIVVDGHSVSRTHARIEWRRGRFYIVDMSSNGTHVHEEQGEGVWVRREDRELGTSGTIGLGEEIAEGSPHAIQYEVLG